MNAKGQLEQRLLVLVTLALVAFGLVMVFSATSASATLGSGDPMTFIIKQGAYALVGLVLLAVGSRFDYHRLRRLAPIMLVGAFGLCAAVLVVAPPVNGAHRWFLVGPVSVQPSELAKIAVCVWACAHLARRPAPRTMGQLIKPLGIVVGLFCGLILLEPDLGTTITLCLMVAGILLVSGVPLRLFALASSLALVIGAAAIYVEPYRRARFLSFIDPWQDPQGAGFQTVQAVIGMGSGGITGEGLGQGISKIFYLPEAHTDMIFAIVGEELGLIGSTVVIGAFGVFAWAGFRIALQCQDQFGKRLAAGITTLVCAQAAVNLAAVLGIAPLTGIPLPFVSYGGSSLIVLLAAVGVLLNIAVNDRVVEARSRGCGRGTAGHVRPALAVAEALRARGATVTFAGSRGRVESQLVPEAGFELDAFPISGFPRRPSVALVRALWQALRAPFACIRILRRRRPDVVLGGGGYVAGPMVLAARLRGVPAALTEADAHLGLANRLAAPFARKVFLAYHVDGRTGAKYEVVGRPVPAAHLGASRTDARARFGIGSETGAVAIFGALAGARSLNEMAVDAWGKSGPVVLHVSGTRDYDQLVGRVARPDYMLMAGTDRFGDVLAAADIAVSRAGGTVWELAAAGTPAILVPYPHATADHQTLNARHFERGGGAIVVPDAELGRVSGLVAELLADPERLGRMRAAMLELALPQAAEAIADGLVALARARGT